MGWSVTGSMVFTAFAAAVQLGIGGILLLRNPRNERVAVFGLLFLLNGLSAGATFAAAGFPEVRDMIVGNSSSLATGLSRVARFADLVTNLVIIILALIYPQRSRWLPRLPHAALLVAAGVAGLLLLRVLAGDTLATGRYASRVLDAKTVLVAYVPFDIAFPIMLLRWSRLWQEPMSAPLRTQFGLVFAAFGIRAVHMMFFIPTLEALDVVEGRRTTTGGLVLGALLLAFIAAALIVSLSRMVRGLFRMEGHDRHWHRFVLAFLAFGALEAVVNLTLRRDYGLGWWHALTGGFDVLVVRPVLLWFAVARTQFLDVRLRSGIFATAVAWVLAAAAVMGGAVELVGAGRPEAWVLAGLVGAAVASMLVAVGQGVFSLRDVWATQGDLETYAALLEEAYRNGPPAEWELARLERRRRYWGINERDHEALVQRIGV